MKSIKSPKIKDIITLPSTAVLNPILEDNVLTCMHGGKVELKAKKAKKMTDQSIGIVLRREIEGASIKGCSNPPILGGPCQKVLMLFPYTYSKHKINDDFIILQLGLIGTSDKGFPILAIPKPNKIKFSPIKTKASKLAKITYEQMKI